MAENKKFFSVEIPLIKDKIKLIAFNIEQLNNRTIKLDLTRQLRGKSLEAVFKIKVEGEKATGKAMKIILMPFFIRRMMRKSISYVEDSFLVESSDSLIRIKPFLITRKKVTRAVRKALREEAKKYLSDYAKEESTDEIFSEIISGRLQKSLSLKLKKIYPLALCEIRQSILEKEKEKVIEEKIK